LKEFYTTLDESSFELQFNQEHTLEVGTRKFWIWFTRKLEQVEVSIDRIFIDFEEENVDVLIDLR